jgi:hypothetical protein
MRILAVQAATPDCASLPAGACGGGWLLPVLAFVIITIFRRGRLPSKVM